jgi:hypothetical protein
MNRPRLVLVGGFLGAGKTTLLLKAASLLQRRGKRVGIITNDQAGALVDTHMASAEGFDTEEVAGACFCCRFSDFIAAAETLRAREPDVVFAEPVGSCIDISATILQPLKLRYTDRYDLTPFTVLVDPAKVQALLDRRANADLKYLFQNQIAEADIVVAGKLDLYPDCPDILDAQARRVSAVSGEGVEDWLADVLSSDRPAGEYVLDVDYARYAAAEAALGWLNWRGNLHLNDPLSAAQVVGPLLDRLDQTLTNGRAEIVHLKIFDRTGTAWIKASICRNSEEPSVTGDVLGENEFRHELILNLRARASPEFLTQAVRSSIESLPGKASDVTLESFRPAPPVPEQRLGIHP